MFNPVRNIAVMLPNGKVIQAMPSNEGTYITINGLEANDGDVLIMREEISGLADIIHTLYPYTNARYLPG